MIFKFTLSLALTLLLAVIMPKQIKRWQLATLGTFVSFSTYMVVLYRDSMWGILGIALISIAIQRFGHKRHLLEAGLNTVALYFMLTYINFLSSFNLLLNRNLIVGQRIPYYHNTWMGWLYYLIYFIAMALTYRMLINSMRKKIGSFKTGHLVIFAADGGVLLGGLFALNYLYRYLAQVSSGLKAIAGMPELLLFGVHASVGFLLLVIFLINSYWMTHFNFKAYQSVAELDALTGIMNRQSGLKRLGEVHRQSRTAQVDFVLCFIDVNNLKLVNDRLGHNEGDRMIKAIATSINRNLREGDFVCRLGGDEFLVCFRSCGIEDAHKAWSRIGNALDALNFNMEFNYRISVSQGFVSFLENKRMTIKELIELADANMYDHKRRYKQGLLQTQNSIR